MSLSKGKSQGNKRSRKGCSTCKARKVKCDERPNGCLNCERLLIPCNGGTAQSTAATAASTAATHAAPVSNSLHRHRTFRSCKWCRGSKLRCSGDRPSCDRCRRRNINCDYDGRVTPRWMARAAASSDADDDTNHQTETIDGSEYSFSDSNDGCLQEATDCAAQMCHENASASFQAADAALEQEDSPSEAEDMSWLFEAALPSRDRQLRLVELYFHLIHPLRCFGFIHKPTFMQRLEAQTADERNNSPLLLIICALGAKFCTTGAIGPTEKASFKIDNPNSAMPEAVEAGNKWAKKAQDLVFSSLNQPSIESAMTTVLLHEHELRIGNCASAFMASGLAVRLTQVLQLNREPTSTCDVLALQSPSSHRAECRRRLLWSVYVMDAWVGSGVEELTMLPDNHMRVRLPSREAVFIQDTTEVELPPWLPADMEMEAQEQKKLDLSAQFILLIRLRKKVLRYVKRLSSALPPWEEGSEFATLYQKLSQWFNSLPEDVRFSRSAIQERKACGQLGALMLLHLTYHQTMCDLTRIGMPALFHLSLDFPEGQHNFVKNVQDVCFDSCVCMASVFCEALQHGQEAFSDTWLCVVAHDATRVIVYYLTRQLGSYSRHCGDGIQSTALSAITMNLQALEIIQHVQPLAGTLLASAITNLKSAGFEMVAASDSPPIDLATSLSTEDSLPDTSGYMLNPLAIYRMAQLNITRSDEDTTGSERLSSGDPLGHFNNPPVETATVLSNVAQTCPIGNDHFEILRSADHIHMDSFQLYLGCNLPQTHMELLFNAHSLPGMENNQEPSGTGFAMVDLSERLDFPVQMFNFDIEPSSAADQLPLRHISESHGEYIDTINIENTAFGVNGAWE